MFRRASLEKVQNKLRIPLENRSDKPNRNLAMRWSCHCAKKEFSKYKPLLNKLHKMSQVPYSGAAATLATGVVALYAGSRSFIILCYKSPLAAIHPSLIIKS